LASARTIREMEKCGREGICGDPSLAVLDKILIGLNKKYLSLLQA